MSKDDDDFVAQIEAISADPKAKDKTAREPRSKVGGSASRLPNKKPLQPRLEKMFAGMGLMLAPIDQVCGMQIVSSAENLANAFDNLANQNPRVRKTLERLLSGGAWGEVFVASMPIIVTVLSHHKILPPSMTDMFNPATNQDSPPQSPNGEKASAESVPVA